MDSLKTLLDWGTDNPLQVALIRTHFTNHQFNEIAQVVFQLRGPKGIPYTVKFLEEEGNKCFKTNDFADASTHYLSGIKLLCFNCITSYADEALFKYLAISLNINLAASELQQRKFLPTTTLCSLVLEFESHNIKSLLRRAKAELGLHNVRKDLCELREVLRTAYADQ